MQKLFLNSIILLSFLFSTFTFTFALASNEYEYESKDVRISDNSAFIDRVSLYKFSGRANGTKGINIYVKVNAYKFASKIEEVGFRGIRHSGNQEEEYQTILERVSSDYPEYYVLPHHIWNGFAYGGDRRTHKLVGSIYVKTCEQNQKCTYHWINNIDGGDFHFDENLFQDLVKYGVSVGDSNYLYRDLFMSTSSKTSLIKGPGVYLNAKRYSN